MTNRQIKALKPIKQTSYPLGGGLVIRVTKGGKTKSFVWTFRRNGRKSKQEWITLGAFPALTLDAARAKAQAARQTLREGGEPGAVEKTAEREAADGPTFGDLVDYFLRKKVAPALRPDRDLDADDKLLAVNTAKAHQGRARKYLGPLRDIAATALRFRDVGDLCDPIAVANGPQAANQVHLLISNIFKTAIKNDRGVEMNPCAGRELPAPLSGESDRDLSNPEIKTLHRIFTTAEQIYLDRIAPNRNTRGGGKVQGRHAQNYRDMADLIWCELLLGNRGGELQSMRWSDLEDTDAGVVFVIPKYRNKSRKRGHRIPLSRQAVAILEARGLSHPARRWHDTFVFPNPTGTGPLVKPAKTQATLFESAGLTGDTKATRHALRHTFATRMGKLNVDEVLIGRMLNHAPSESAKITRRYNHHQYDAQKRAALQQWADHLYGEILKIGPRRLREVA